MSKRGLPSGLKMRHDFHYVEELSKTPRIVGRMIPLDKIDPNPEQPRVEIGDLSELAASIKDKGVLEPLLVKPLVNQQNAHRWLIIAGERRWRAARLAGLTEVPCIELDVDAAQIAEIALIENLQRKDLNVWEEADGLASLCQRFGYTHDDVARKIGKSRSTVTESLTVASLPPEIREKCREARITSKSIILQIARQFDEAAMLRAIAGFEATQNFNQGTSVDKTEVDNRDNGRTESKNSSSVQTKFRQTHSLQTTDLSTPVRAFSYQSSEGDYKLALKFKKPVGKEVIISSLRMILAELEHE